MTRRGVGRREGDKRGCALSTPLLIEDDEDCI